MVVSGEDLENDENRRVLTARTTTMLDDAKRAVYDIAGAYAEATSDMILADGADLSPFTSGGQNNVLTARLHLSVLEALIQSIWAAKGGPGLDVDGAKEILNLFKLHRNVLEKLREKEKVRIVLDKLS